MQRFQGRHVVVTGASSGIGRALSVAFGREGAHVWMGARDEKALAEAAREVDAAGGKGHPARLDVTEDASVAAFAAAVAEGAGEAGVHVLVNNAGIGARGRVEEVDAETWRRVLATNLTGPFLVTKAILPLLRKAEGRRQVVNVVSVAGKQAFPGSGTYAASKFGLRGWTEALAGELAEEGIRVTAVLPGYVATPLVGAGKGGPRDAKMIQPADLAKVVLDLATLPESAFVDEVVVWPWEMYTD